MATKSCFSAANILSSANRDRCMKNFTSFPTIVKATTDVKAAVLVPLCIANGEMSLLFTLRSKDLNSHAGHVSFPGGKFDLEDKDLVTTALRETEEELAIPRDSIDIWGQGATVPSKDFKIAVTPVIGYIKNFDSLKVQINPAEVEEAFTVTLERLCDPQYFSVISFKNGWKLPQFDGGPHKIWGLTSIVTHMFLASLLSEEAYPMKLNEEISRKRPKPKL